MSPVLSVPPVSEQPASGVPTGDGKLLALHLARAELYTRSARDGTKDAVAAISSAVDAGRFGDGASDMVADLWGAHATLARVNGELTLRVEGRDGRDGRDGPRRRFTCEEFPGIVFDDEKSLGNARDALNAQAPCGFLVTGPAGSGKSRFVRQCLDSLFSPGVSRVAGEPDTDAAWREALWQAAEDGYLYIDNISRMPAYPAESYGLLAQFLTGHALTWRVPGTQEIRTVKRGCVSFFTSRVDFPISDDYRRRLKVIRLAAGDTNSGDALVLEAGAPDVAPDLSAILLFPNGSLSAQELLDRNLETVLQRTDVLKLLTLFIKANRQELAGLYWTVAYLDPEIEISASLEVGREPDWRPVAIAKRWPGSKWERKKPRHDRKNCADWVAVVQGVTLRITGAEQYKPVSIPAEGPVALEDFE